MPPGVRMGPQGVTMDDVRRVANGDQDIYDSRVGAGGYTFTRLPARAGRIQQTPTVPSLEAFATRLVGGAAPTYGQKHGGLPTAELFKAAVIGGTEPFYQGAELARQQAADVLTPLSRLAEERIARNYGYTLPANLALETNPMTGLPVPREMLTYAEATPEMTAAEAKLNAAEEAKARLASQQAAFEPHRQRLAELEAGYGATQGMDILPAFRSGQEAQREDVRILRQQRDRLDTAAAAADMASRQAQAELALASRNRTGMLRTGQVAIEQGLKEDIGREVTPYLDLASQIESTPVYELARKIAQERYGYGADVAAGLFTPEIDVNRMQDERAYQRELMYQAYGMDPSLTMEDMILQSGGGEALAQYRQQKVENEFARLQEGALTAEEEQYDAMIEQQLGINPGDVAVGDVSTARQVLSDPTFQQALADGVNELATSSATTAEEKKNLAKSLANDMYVSMLENGADNRTAMVTAEILLNSLVRFDFLTFAEG